MTSLKIIIVDRIGHEHHLRTFYAQGLVIVRIGRANRQPDINPTIQKFEEESLHDPAQAAPCGGVGGHLVAQQNRNPKIPRHRHRPQVTEPVIAVNPQGIKPPLPQLP